MHLESRFSVTQFIKQSAWVVFPVAGMLWVATRYRYSWYKGDEWGTIELTVGSNAGFRTAFSGYNGHLQAPTYAVYWLQRAWFGVESHQFVWLVFCISLGALLVSIAAVLKRLGVPTIISLLAAALVTFFGAGAQNMAWQFQLGVNFSIALCLAAVFMALRNRATTRAAIAIACLLVLAWISDSQLAVTGAVFVGVVVLILWPWRAAAIALGPPILPFAAWFAFSDNGGYLPTSVGTMTTFSWHLFTLSAGGLVGGGETQRAAALGIGASSPPSPTIPLPGEVVGVIALGLATTCVIVGLARHRLSRAVKANLVGGLTAAVAALALIAKTRSFLIPVRFLPVAGSRYIQLLAIFLLLAFLPAVVATLRPATRTAQQWATIATCVMLISVFVVNLDQLRPERHFEEAWGTNVKTAVRQTVAVLNEGCGPRRAIDPRAKPTKQSPEITVRLLQDLMARGDLTRDFGTRATPKMRDAVCRSTNA